MSVSQFFIRKDGKIYGPFIAGQIKQFVSAGKLLPEHELASSTDGPWSPAGNAKGLFLTELAKASSPSPSKSDGDLAPDAIVGPAKAFTTSILGGARSLVGKSTERGVVVAEAVKPIPPAVRPHPLARFLGEGQDSSVVVKLHKRVSEICTSQEQILYLAAQSKPIANFSPDCVAITNRRFIIFRQKLLGQVSFIDCLWKDCKNVHMKENIIGATVAFQGFSGHVETIDYIPKEQARMIYRHAQEFEEKAINTRREMKIEELQAGADKTVINQAIGVGPQPVAAMDPVAKLTQLKQLLDSGIIEQSEFNAKKAELLKLL